MKLLTSLVSLWAFFIKHCCSTKYHAVRYQRWLMCIAFIVILRPVAEAYSELCKKIERVAFNKCSVSG